MKLSIYLILGIFLLLALPLLAVNVTYYPEDLGCWRTQYFSNSQPWYYLQFTVPQNATQVMITTLEGRGGNSIYNLRNCAYTSCTTYQYYNSICPVIVTLPFGTVNITSFLSPGSYFLTLDSINGLESRQFLYSAITIYFDNFSYTQTNNSFIFYDNSTVFSAVVNVVDNGQCTVAIPIDARKIELHATNGTQQPFVISVNSINWSCIEAASPYSISWNLPAIRRQQFWQQSGNATFYSQLFSSTLSIFNPAQQQSYAVVPFNFSIPENFSIFNSMVEGNIQLAAGETKNVTVFFNASVISAITNSSAAGTLDNIIITSSVSIFNNFSLAAVTIDGETVENFARASTTWPCDESEITIKPIAAIQLYCVSFSPLNFSLAGNSSLVVVNPFNFSISLRDVRSSLLRLTGFNYSVEDNFIVTPNSSTIINISLILQSISETNQNATALQETASAEAGGFEQQTYMQNNTSSEGDSEPDANEGEKPSFTFEEKRTPYTQQTAQTNQEPPSTFSFLATAANFAPFAALAALIGLAPIMLKKKKMLYREINSNKVSFTVVNIHNEPMKEVVLQEIVGENVSNFSELPVKSETILGHALEWRKGEVQPGEKWILTYESPVPKLKKARLHFEVDGKEKEIIMD